MKSFVKSMLLSAIGITIQISAQETAVRAGIPWISDNLDGTYTNPVIYADYSDPDVIRVDDNFYMVSSSFSQFPGIPVLQSKDLVNWEIIGHVVQDYPFYEFNKPQHGKGLWAPSLRYHNNKFWVFVGDPDHGILMSTAENPAGPWTPLHIVQEGKGLIDPCPFWDDDGNAYLVHAWAKSRAGFNSILTLRRMSPDGLSLIDSGKTVYDGHDNHPTIEGPKLYKRNGYYYIFAPAGGVKPGWQTILRSKNIYGPYEDKVVLEQGSTDINGPHQGGLVELDSGESWFVHFQDRYAYGRVVMLNPVNWVNDWPEMGIDLDGNSIGEPVHVWNKPLISANSLFIAPQTNDEFNSYSLGLQWQWEALYDNSWYSLSDNPGNLRLFSQHLSTGDNLRDLAGIIGQKFPAEKFVFSTKLTSQNSRAGVVVLGMDYSAIELVKTTDDIVIRQVECIDADKDGEEKEIESVKIGDTEVYIKIYVNGDAYCTFAYSTDGIKYEVFGETFKARAGRWVGARIGLYSVNSNQNSQPGYADFDWVRLE